MNDAARGKKLSVLGMALALMRNYDPFQSPTHFKLADLLKKFDKTFGATGRNYGKVTGDRTKADIEKRRADRWNFLFIAGMWFQDLFNNDFRRQLQESGLVISGTNPEADLVEVVELADHPWFLGCQFHPEFKSRPMDPHPLFESFVGACRQARKG